MRKLASLILLLLVGCGPTPNQIAHTPSPSGKPAAKVELLFAVLEAHGADANAYPPLHDTVAIVGLDGYARAKQTFEPRKRPFIGNAAPHLQPEARVAAGKVFYADGTGKTRSLSASGAVSDVASFPISQAQQELAFAVSPGGNAILATVLTLPPRNPNAQTPADPPFSPGDARIDLLRASTGGSTEAVRSWSFPLTNRAPIYQMVAWDPVGPVATVDTPLGGQDYTGYEQWFGHASRLDSSGQAGPTLGGTDCLAVGESADGNVIVCSDRAKVTVRRASGDVLWSLPSDFPRTGYGSLALSPDGARLAYADIGHNRHAAVSGRDGSTTSLPNGFLPQGWLDATTVIGVQSENLVDLGNMALVRLSEPTKLEDLGFKGFFIGVVQGAKAQPT